MSLHVFFGVLYLVALALVIVVFAIYWLKSMVEQFRDRAWGFLAMFTLIPLAAIGYIGWQVTS